jgi:hypothetical protein
MFLDLKKAFDLVNHDILLYKLQKYSFGHDSIMLIANYLSNRYISVGDSDLYLMSYGVPQGSILGPIFFSLFINDIFLEVTFCSIICFADDTVVYLPITEVKDAIMFSDEVSVIFKWFSNNHLFLNFDKCELLNFYITKNIISELDSLHITSHQYKFKKHYKYLGVTIDFNLKFTSQFNKLFSICGHYISVFKFLKSYISKKHLGNIYLAFILPIIEYCSTSYLHFSLTKLNKLNKLNNYILSFTNLNHICYCLPNRLLINSIRLVSKIEKGLVPIMFLDKRLTHSINTRSQSILPFVNKNIFHHSFCFWFNKLLVSSSMPTIKSVINNNLAISVRELFDLIYA